MIEEKSISIIFICRNTIDYYQMCKFKKIFSIYAWVHFVYYISINTLKNNVIKRVL